MDTKVPTRKVGLGAAVGSVVTIGIWVASLYHVSVPGEVGAAAVTGLSFLAAYWIKDAE